MTVDWERLEEAYDHKRPLALTQAERQGVERCSSYLEAKLKNLDVPVYGVNTGFGSLCEVVVTSDQLRELQHNLIRSHAAGFGDSVSARVVQWMLWLKVRSLAAGHSGVQPATVDRLIDFYNRRLLPVVPERGSLGASGDLAPLAHLCLPLIGEGEFIAEGGAAQASLLLAENGLEPLELSAKEGLALLNGTQFMSAHAVESVLRLRRLLAWSNVVSALSLDVFDARTEPFHPLLQQIRPQAGQVETARAVAALRADSELAQRTKRHVQDPYSFRCIPQVHGSARDAARFAEEIILTEVNSVSDNPNIFPDEDLILSGGNFHGQSIALALDVLALGMTHLAGISERRTYQLQQGLRGLPPFLTPNPGLQSGMMILQYTAAGLVNQMKHNAQPHSADSIPSCNGQEDYVSMGANAAVKCLQQVELLAGVLAVEWLHACQALDLRRPLRSGSVMEELHAEFRRNVPALDGDRNQSDDLRAAVDFMAEVDVRPRLAALI